MWQSFLIVLIVFLLIAIYFYIGRKPSYRRKTYETIKAWVAVYKGHLPEQEAIRLKHALENWQEKNPDATLRLTGHFLRAYRHLTRQTLNLEEALEKAPKTRIDLFSPGEEAYLAKHDKHVVVTTLNDDNTYTVCDVIDVCHRVYEMELIKTEPVQSPETRSST